MRLIISTLLPTVFSFFYFNDPATTEIYTLSLHDALPILRARAMKMVAQFIQMVSLPRGVNWATEPMRSEEHTSELQSHSDLVCRLLLEKKKKNKIVNIVI